MSTEGPKRTSGRRGMTQPDGEASKSADQESSYNPFKEPLSGSADDVGDLTPEQVALLKERVAQFKGRSLVDIAESEIDTSKTLFGDRLLCIGGGLLLVAPTGVGKSTTQATMSVHWSCGKAAFGLRPARPLKILIVQAENDDGDMTEMTRDVVAHLSPEDRESVRRNTVCVHINSFCSFNFIFVLSQLLKMYKPDLVVIDPFNAFSGGDPSDPTVVTTFLRNWLNPLLEKYQCAAMIVHHTPKTRNWDTSKWKPSDWAYAAAGNNDMSNWARAIIVIDATDDPDLYRFILAKRGRRAGWKDDFGDTALMRYFARSKKGILWSEATPEQIAGAEHKAALKKKQGRKQKYPDQKLLKHVLDSDCGMSFSELQARVKADGCPIGQTTLWERWEKWQEDGLLTELESDKCVLSANGMELFNSLRQKKSSVSELEKEK